MSDTRFFSWKEQPPKSVRIEGKLAKEKVIIVVNENFQIDCYENRIKLNDHNGKTVTVSLHEGDKEARGHLRRGLIKDYLEIITIEDNKIEPTLTVNLCFNNRFYFGWLPLFLAILTACVSPFIWKKVRQGKKVK